MDRLECTFTFHEPNIKSVLDAAVDSEKNNDAEKNGLPVQPQIKNEVPSDTSKVFKLQKVKSIYTKPSEELFVKKFSSNGKLNIFRYSFGKRKMARTGGTKMNARGFNYTSKSQIKSKDVWPYPAPKVHTLSEQILIILAICRLIDFFDLCFKV